MPLPEADETATYERIQTKKIQYPIGNFLTDSRPDDVLTQEQFQIVKNQVTIQETNEDELRRLNLVGTASNQSSLSGPFRNIVVSGELTSTGYLKLQPDLPGMYQLSAVDAEVSGCVHFGYCLPVQDPSNVKAGFYAREINRASIDSSSREYRDLTRSANG